MEQKELKKLLASDKLKSERLIEEVKAIDAKFGGKTTLGRRRTEIIAAKHIDKIEALDGLFARYVPAATFAIFGPAIVLLAVSYADPWAALLLLGCGILVPAGMAIAGIGAAAASRNQFLSMARLQARFRQG